MSIFKKGLKAAGKVAKPAGKRALRAYVGGKSTPTLRSVLRAAKTYNPVTGPVGAIKKVTRALKPRQRRGRNRQCPRKRLR